MSNLSIATLSGLMGFCGVIYEFVLAQSLTILFGQSVVQYSLTIGLFLGGMGVGAKLAESWSAPAEKLRALQITLALGAPVVFFAVWYLALSGWPNSSMFLGYGLCFSIGILTGCELPLLIRISGRAHLMIGADYLGMLAACALFPLVFLPEAGLFLTLFFAALINAFTAPILARNGRFFWIIPMAIICAMFLEPSLRDWLSYTLVQG